MKSKKTRTLTKLQVFAAIAWVVMTGMHTLYFLNSDLDFEHYLIGLAIISGTCLLAWGMPFGPISSYLATGKPLRPFMVGKPRKKRASSKQA